MLAKQRALLLEKHKLRRSAAWNDFAKNISICGAWGYPQQAAKNRWEKYERIVNRHNLKMRFWKSGYPLALLAKLVNGENGNDFASRIGESVYTLALLAKNVIA